MGGEAWAHPVTGSEPAARGHRAVRFDAETMWVGLSDGRVIGVLLGWFPRLLRAGPAARAAVEISPLRLHWEALEENVSVEGLLVGRWE